MRHVRHGLSVLCLLAIAASPALGQTPAALIDPPAWLYNDIACAPMMTSAPPPALRLIGSQDPSIKHMLGPGDTLVVNGGSATGLQTGQLYFVRRNIKSFGVKGPDATHAVSVHTAGWIRILGVDTAVATATVLHACDGMLLDDYLEPFAAPKIAAAAAPGNAPQYANMGRITSGDEQTEHVGPGQMIGIDRGSRQGVVLGQRYFVYRDKRQLRNEGADYSATYARSADRLPIVQVAEVAVVAVGADTATVQVTIATDSVMIGIYRGDSVSTRGESWLNRR